MNKNNIILNICEKYNYKKHEVEIIFDAIFIEIEKALSEDESVLISNFGTFERKLRKERVAVNPQTGKKIVVPASHTTSFKPSKNLKKTIEF